jgi:hypothetical protein
LFRIPSEFRLQGFTDMDFKGFLRDERGAVTADWVVLSSGIVGLGFATISAVSPGIQDLSLDISNVLTDYEISDGFFNFTALQILAQDFSGAQIGAWTGAVAADKGMAMGDILMVGPGGTAMLEVDVPPGANEAVFTFDLIGGDSLDSETATIMINGQPVLLATGNHGQITFANGDVPGISVETNVISQGTQLGGQATSNRLDSVTTVSITVDNPGTSMTLGVASNADQSTHDEFFGIDNFSINAS